MGSYVGTCVANAVSQPETQSPSPQAMHQPTHHHLRDQVSKTPKKGVLGPGFWVLGSSTLIHARYILARAPASAQHSTPCLCGTWLAWLARLGWLALDGLAGAESSTFGLLWLRAAEDADVFVCVCLLVDEDEDEGRLDAWMHG